MASLRERTRIYQACIEPDYTDDREKICVSFLPKLLTTDDTINFILKDLNTTSISPKRKTEITARRCLNGTRATRGDN